MHDKNGTPVKKGDCVFIPAVITSTTGGDEFCNVTVETEEAMFPGDNKTVVTLNAKQVVLFESAAE